MPSQAAVFTAYLEYFRGGVAERVRSLAPPAARVSRLPSGWTPIELVRHLTYVERRWLEWGFEGLDVGDPWGDRRDGRWHVGDDEDDEEVLAALADQGVRTASIIASHDLNEVGQPSGRWDGEAPPTLERILFHLLQEYARHLGHLDVVAEIAGGSVGE